jgi:hypothetical protein
MAAPERRRRGLAAHWRLGVEEGARGSLVARWRLRSGVVEDVAMLLDGLNHVALLTGNTERFVSFYSEVFGAEVVGTQDAPIGRLTFVRIGPHTEFNLFEVEGNTEAERQTPILGRGRLDHFGPAGSVDQEISRRFGNACGTGAQRTTS